MLKNRDLKTKKPRGAYGPAQWAVFLLAVALITALPTAATRVLRAAGDGVQWRLPENPLEGRDLFITKKCVNCHSVWGEGNDLGPDLSQIGKNRSLMQLSGLLWNHSERMSETMTKQGIERPTFEPEEMRSLLSYIFFLNYFDEPGEFREGERLFREKKCIECHSVGTVGGSAIPLDRFMRDMSSIHIAQAMWNAGEVMTSMMKDRGIEVPKFTGAEYSHLLAFIRETATGEAGEPLYLHPGNPEKGKKTFEEKGCSSCHAINGGSKIGPNLNDRALWTNVSNFTAIMWNHSSKMWAKMKQMNNIKPTFDGNELADVIAYIFFNFFYLDEEGDPVIGKKLFASKNCARCHQVGGMGTMIGPELTKPAHVNDPVALATSMWNHAPAMADMLTGENVVWPKFSGNEMSDLISFIRANAVARKKKPEKTE